MTARHYVEPGHIERRIVHRPVAWLARRGISVAGSRELAVRGRRTGEWRRVPVNPLRLGGREYLVSVRGEGQWVRNLRASGGGILRLGRTLRRFDAWELEDASKPEILRAYLRRWGWEVSGYFQGAGPDATDDELLRIAPLHPVFRITARR